MGHPINHSTHCGFSSPPICSLKGREFFPRVASLTLPLRQSRAIGVAKRSRFATAVARPSPLLALAPLRLWFPCTVGVGHEPETVAPVRRTDIGSTQHCPSAVIPERGKVAEDSPQASSNEGWAVFHEHVLRSNVANDARHVDPKSGALAVDACAFAGERYVLAGKAARYDVNTPSPSQSIKGCNVIPYRESRQKAVELAGHQYACGVGIALDGAHGPPAEQCPAEDAAAGSGEQREFAQARIRAALKIQVIQADR